MITHRFQPEHYFTTIGSHQPVLQINPGDRVVTTTVDAHGIDATGEQITPPGNPMTGPFFVTGAEPGDTLVLHLERISPNRAEGWSACYLAPGVLDPEAVNQLSAPKTDQPRLLAKWALDITSGTAELKSPETGLGGIRLPLAPMLGCFGVAPENGQSISTSTSGEYGGNMDYRGFCAGVTAYLPVFVPGALFFLGDGHAVQGDGEIVGTGIEVSMDVEFRVEIIKNQAISWPHGETEDTIFTVGNARPLDQALQHATTEMMRWLKDAYGLDAMSAGLLLGQTVTYEVGNVFDPAYTIVCKILKPERFFAGSSLQYRSF
ncbi:MAG: acetamidase/formamidase family protein [Anaerolineaceae bacterium]|nr:acetamidase/formamidase family protein [Anaerolineaceae bacterium]